MEGLCPRPRPHPEGIQGGLHSRELEHALERHRRLVGLVGVERIRLSDAMRSDYRVRLDGYGCYGWCGQVEIVVEIKNKPYNGYNGRNELSKDQPLNHTSPSTG